MYTVIRQSFGSVTAGYYIRHLVFGAMFPVLLLVMSSGAAQMSVGLHVAMIVNTFLYPYARFFYERVVGFVIGVNEFIVGALFAMFMKVLTMTFCWSAAVVLAPIGLLYLGFTRQR
ncbi:hypothetical protein [Paraburkholderia humisilvae]|nr:hypothetical protein [Paraburkholderia humisilvae]